MGNSDSIQAHSGKRAPDRRVRDAGDSDLLSRQRIKQGPSMWKPACENRSGTLRGFKPTRAGETVVKNEILSRWGKCFLLTPFS
jgi:hypothetical protein